MKMKIFKWSLAIAWMIIIFKLSHEPAVISDQKSGLVINILSFLGVNLNSIMGKYAEFIVRKTAHFTEYSILFLLLHNALSKKGFESKKAIYAMLVTFLYACSDEFHQLFVMGRDGRIRDIMIDTSGGITALLLINAKNYFRWLRHIQINN